MNFFKPEDFLENCGAITPFGMAEKANAKLERDGKVVFSIKDENYKPGYRAWVYNNCPENKHTHKAILIAIQEIKKCEHPKDKIKQLLCNPASQSRETFFECECGARVEPTEFREVK